MFNNAMRKFAIVVKAVLGFNVCTLFLVSTASAKLNFSQIEVLQEASREADAFKIQVFKSRMGKNARHAVVMAVLKKDLNSQEQEIFVRLLKAFPNMGVQKNELDPSVLQLVQELRRNPAPVLFGEQRAQPLPKSLSWAPWVYSCSAAGLGLAGLGLAYLESGARTWTGSTTAAVFCGYSIYYLKNAKKYFESLKHYDEASENLASLRKAILLSETTHFIQFSKFAQVLVVSNGEEAANVSQVMRGAWLEQEELPGSNTIEVNPINVGAFDSSFEESSNETKLEPGDHSSAQDAPAEVASSDVPAVGNDSSSPANPETVPVVGDFSSSASSAISDEQARLEAEWESVRRRWDREPLSQRQIYEKIKRVRAEKRASRR